MKKYLLVLLLLPLIALSQSQTVFLDARGRDCAGGLGLCSSGITSNTDHTIAATFTKISDNSFAMVFENKNTSETDQKKIAGKTFSEMKATENPYFFQESDFSIPETILQKINISPEASYIKQGKYPFIFEDKTSSVIITLGKK
ncbi:hypothetical protein LNP04_00990 [Chryseobacterium sp. C-71]|uniref:hypothetical protein n=1 Tax=Chryseobacterium sp. C-71 TaxID=2893882 RepID=UPI001E2D78B9|nr:hypothetical protein [Chryseobacterium sp. C-71]UFH32310.1 hypothetical protein LNP04_00990 [Chryseobacterium sp. C-71]